MESLIFVAFLTGLTAGGLSCFAVQGGLITGSIAQQVELAVRGRKTTQKESARVKASPPKGQAQMGQAMVLFILAKLAAYTVAGFLLGALGSVFTPSPLLKGAIQAAIGVFLVGNALRMFEVHPIFRYFTFEPPSQLTRWIRRLSRKDDPWTTPVFLGLLTVLIPCGITQSMMALAVGTGNPWMGAAVLFAFILGTSPTFLAVTYLATSLGSMFQKNFYRVVAVLVLVLGLYTVDTGLVVMGSPVSASGWVRSITASPESSAPAVTASGPAQIQVVNSGYLPASLALPAGQAVELHWITENTRSCSRAIVIPALNIQEILPQTGDTVTQIPPQAAGTVIQYSCSMGMYWGELVFK